MKLTTLILFALVSMMSLTQLKRTEATLESSSKTKDNGSGSWDEGFVCPRITVRIGSVETTEATNVKFFPKNLVNPATSPDTIGWSFIVGVFNANLKKFAFKEGEKWYIPFRFLNGKFTFANPFLNNKTISGWATNDQGETALITVHLPYKRLGWYINDEEGNLIATLINKHTTQAQGKIRTAKNGAQQASSAYIVNKPLSTAAAGNEAKLNTEVANQETLLNNLKTSIAALKVKAEASTSKVADLRTKLALEEQVFQGIQSEINNMSTHANTINENVTSLKNNSTTNAEKKKVLTKAATNALETLNLHLATLKVEAPPRQNEVELAGKAVEALNEKEFVSNLKKIVPTA